jgi:hypothetical protein
MVIQDKKHFYRGLGLAISFLILLMVIISPVFEGKNGLEYADDMFNKLSKGSSYFIPDLARSIEKFKGEQIQVSINFETPEEVKRTVHLLNISQIKAESQGKTLKIEGNLGELLVTALRDADLMYHNEGEKVKSLYGYNEKQVMKDWWQLFDRLGKDFKKNKVVEKAEILSKVNKKGIEAAYNFYQIDPVKVSERAGILSGLLIFYVCYTLWWGFALMYLVEGLGLTMKKGVRKEE